MLFMPLFSWQFSISALVISAACHFLIIVHFPSASPLSLFPPVARPPLQLLEHLLIDGFCLGHHGFSAVRFDRDGHDAAHVHQPFLTSPHPGVQLTSPSWVALQSPLLRHGEAQQARQNLIGQLHVQVTSSIGNGGGDVPKTVPAAQLPQESHNESFDTDLCGVGVWSGHRLIQQAQICKRWRGQSESRDRAVTLWIFFSR